MEASRVTTAAHASPLAGARQVVADYVELTKPRVQSLLLLTTITTMYVAGDPSLGARRADLPRRLAVGRRRRRRQPLVRPRHRRPDGPHRQPAGARGADRARRGAVFGIVLAALSFVLLSLTVNVLSASLALCGFLGYVLVYTVWLKRRTPQNIVIGGAAGAVPPLVGWAAVTGSLDPTALYLFAIVFYWTPPHFWALSLLMKDEYARVGVPMMPVVHGEAETRRQIVLYTVPARRADAAAGRVRLLRRALRRRGGRARRRLPRPRACACSARADRRAALRTYLFSLLYLALLFVAMVADTRL